MLTLQKCRTSSLNVKCKSKYLQSIYFHEQRLLVGMKNIDSQDRGILENTLSLSVELRFKLINPIYPYSCRPLLNM